MVTIRTAVKRPSRCGRIERQRRPSGESNRRRACSRHCAEPEREPASALAFESHFRLPSPRPSRPSVPRVGRGIRTELAASPRERRGAHPHDAPRVHSVAVRQSPGGLARTADTWGRGPRAAVLARSRNRRRIGQCAVWGCSFGALTTTSESRRKQGECHVAGVPPTGSRAQQGTWCRVVEFPGRASLFPQSDGPGTFRIEATGVPTQARPAAFVSPHSRSRHPPCRAGAEPPASEPPLTSPGLAAASVCLPIRPGC